MQRVFRLSLCVAFAAVSILGQSDKKWTVADVPNPMTEPDKCGNTEPGFVCNPESLLDASAVEEINRTVTNLISETPCLCAKGCEQDRDGFVVSVLVVNAIAGPQDTAETAMATMKSFTGALRTAWDFGDCGNDITILVVTDRKFLESSFDKVWTSTGGVTKIPLTDRCVAATTKEDKSIFADNQRIAEGILSLLQKFGKTLKDSGCAVDLYKNENESEGTEETPAESPDMAAKFKQQEWILIGVGILVCVIFFATCVTAVICIEKRGSRKKRRYMAANPEQPESEPQA